MSTSMVNRMEGAMRYPVCCLAVLMSVTAEGGAMQDVVSQDLRGRFDPMVLHLYGGSNPSGYCKSDAQGLRITIPSGTSHRSTWGAETRLVVQGDFEITGSYEILNLPEPGGGYGAGIRIDIEDAKGVRAGVVRLHRPGVGHGYAARIAVPDRAGKYQHTSRRGNTDAMSGRLRLRRTAEELVYLAAEDGSDEFIELHRVEFGGRDVVSVRFGVNTGEWPAQMDVLWKDVELRADRLAKPHELRRRGWLWPVGSASALVIGAAAWWIRRRQLFGSW